MKNTELEAFAAEVYREALKIVGAAGGQGRAAELALALSDRAANVRNGVQMVGEQADLREDRFDLAALKVNLQAADASEPKEAKLQE